MPTQIPVYFGTPEPERVAADLRAYGVAVVDTMRSAATRLASDLERELQVAQGREDEGEFVLHLSCLIEPAMEIGWIEYYVYPRAFDRDAMRAKGLIEAAVRQWHAVGQPPRYLATLNG